GEDLLEIKPTVLVSVPRIFERVNTKVQAKLAQDSAIKRRLFALAVRLGWHRFEHEQGRAAWTSGLLLQPLLDRLVGAKIRGRLGGNLRFAVTGGAPMPPEISRIFIGLGITVVQGYGLTETSPMITANHLEDNDPASVGKCVPGQELRIGERDEILTRGPHVMLGYWNNELATRDMIDDDGWLHTGDQGRLDDRGHLFITGRLKEIIILANGENLPPAEMEMTISQDELVDQVLVVGDNRPFLTALVVPNEEAMASLQHQLNLELGEYAVNGDTLNQRVLERVQRSVENFPGYAKLMRIALVHEPWTVENGLMTPTMKLKRARILENHQDLVDRLYAGHE
ncbi:MAG: AMP-binding protein, partial [Pseudomonadota bacterium]